MSDATPDLAAFRALEEAGWADSDIAGRYTDWFPRLTSQAVPALLDVLAISFGHSILDLACGPGVVAATAGSRWAAATGLDFSASMVEIAARQNPDAEFAQGDVESLPFRAASFDTIAMNYGLLHLAQPEAALREVFRVLKPGGSFAFTVWALPEHAVGFQIILDAVAAHGRPGVTVPAGPPFFRFSDPEESKAALESAGFLDARVMMVPQTWQLPSSDAFFSAIADGTVRTRALLSGQDEASLKAIRTYIDEALTPYGTPDGIELPMPAMLAWGLKP